MTLLIRIPLAEISAERENWSNRMVDSLNSEGNFGHELTRWPHLLKHIQILPFSS